MEKLVAAACIVCIVALLGCATTSSTEARNPSGRQTLVEGWSADGRHYFECFHGSMADVNLATELIRAHMVEVLVRSRCTPSADGKVRFKANVYGFGARKYIGMDDGLCILMEGPEPIQVLCDDQ